VFLLSKNRPQIYGCNITQNTVTAIDKLRLSSASGGQLANVFYLN